MASANHQPDLIVSRAVAACNPCRKQKIKCDGNGPPCGSCRKHGKIAECSNSDDQFARGKDRSYPAFLESKLAKLRRKLADAQKDGHALDSPPSIEARHPVSRATSPASPPSPAYSNSHSNALAKAQEANDLDNLVSSFGVLSVNAAARDYEGFTSLMSVVRLILWAASNDILFDLPSDARVQDLPPKDEANALGHEYLNNSLIVFPVIEQFTFSTSLEAVYYPDRTFATPWNHWILRMVLANAYLIRSTVFNDDCHRLARFHVMSALPYAEVALRPDTIPSIQAMLLLVEYSRYDPRAFDHWTLVGAVSRAMVDLGLHQDPPRSANISKNKLETRRRLFLCVYSADRTTSIPMDRAFTFSEASTNVDVAASLLNAPEPSLAQEAHMWIKPYRYSYWYFSIRRVQSQVYQDLHQSGREAMSDPYLYVQRMWKEMNDWYNGLPSNAPRPLLQLADAEILASYIMLLAPSPRIPEICELAQNIIFEFGIQYAGRVYASLASSDLTWMSFTSFLRIRKLAHIFNDNLQAHLDRLIAGSPPRMDTPNTSFLVSAVPPQTTQNREKNAQRCEKCINQFSAALNKFGDRMGLHELANSWLQELAESFGNQSKPTLQSLSQMQHNS